jgi:hypothetical protein
LTENKLTAAKLSTLLEQKSTNYYTKLQVDEIGQVVSIEMVKWSQLKLDRPAI